MLGFLRGLTALIVGLVVAAIALFVGFIALANVSTSKSAFKCDGELTTQGGTRAATISFLLKEYPWWFWWADTNGMIFVEAPDENIAYEPYLGLDKVAESAVHIYEDSAKRGFRGAFYKLSKHLELETRSRGFFSGNCVTTDVPS